MHILETMSSTMEYSLMISDIWICIILTLLIVLVMFFLCTCFLFHKLQQWRSLGQNGLTDPIELNCRSTNDFEGESLPSYTIVCGLPTYDDVLEQFRKSKIILYPPSSENRKIPNQFNMPNGHPEHSTTCTNVNTPVIQFTPDQLAVLSRKRLSLQIAFDRTGSINGNNHLNNQTEAYNNFMHLISTSQARREYISNIPRTPSRLSMAIELNRQANMLQGCNHR